MSNALALAATTAVIRRTLSDGIAQALADPAYAGLSGILGTGSGTAGAPLITSVPPDRIIGSATEPTQLNLFLYEVTYNAGYANTALPVRNGQGQRLSAPPLALDLHYLLSAYGAGDLVPEILLGLAMQLLHVTPVLTRNLIRRVFTPPPPPPPPPVMVLLATAGLDEQIEVIKLSPHPMVKSRPQAMTSDDLSDMWSAFQNGYRLSTAFLATVVLIETKTSTRQSLPVRVPNVNVTPLRHPVIDRVEPTMVLPGGTLTVSGHDLLTSNVALTTALFGSGQPGTIDGPNSTNDRLAVTVPAGVRAGVNTVRVTQSVTFGTDPTPHPGFQSNAAALMVRPTITQDSSTPSGYAITVTVPPPVPAPPAPRDADVAVTLAPPVGKAQQVTLLLNQRLPPPAVDAAAYSFDAESRAADPSAAVAFKARRVTPGDYLVRVRVDGAESPLDVNGTGAYSGPLVTI
jgi:hypothetical protein